MALSPLQLITLMMMKILTPKLNFTFTSPQKKIVNVAMSNTFGFGGHNACVIFRKLD